MKPSTTNRWVIRIIILVLLAIIIFLFFKCCRCCRPQVRIKKYPDEILVFRNPDSPYSAFKASLDHLKAEIAKSGDITDSEYCPTCDSDLVLLKGPGVQIHIQQAGSGGTGGGTTGGPGGGNAGYYCANLAITSLDTGKNEVTDTLHLEDTPRILNPRWKPSRLTNSPVTVAVLDTGLDSTDIDKTFVGNFTQTCPGFTGQRGWNFIANNSNTYDDHPHRHGTKVTRLILNQVLHYQGLPSSRAGAVNILPVKVFDTSGLSSLYKILCGVSYAASSGAKIINASFGYYDYTDTTFSRYADTIVQKYLAHYLRSRNILMIACAGNAIHYDDSVYRKAIAVPGANPRNLDSNKFYPASFVRDSLRDNLLVVTTIYAKDHSISPLQNFSPGVVDVGVNCDAIIHKPDGDLYVFLDPIQNIINNRFPAVTGSSFATPIVTGKIAAHYSTLVGAGTVNKEAILKGMQVLQPEIGSKPLLILSSPGDKLAKFIHKGAISHKIEGTN